MFQARSARLWACAALGATFFTLCAGCFISPDEKLWRNRVGLDAAADQAAPDGPATEGIGPDNAPGDAPPSDTPWPDVPWPDAPWPDLTPISCDAKYGKVPGYILCTETATTCRFNAKTSGGTCKQICTQAGGSCLKAENNNIAPCQHVVLDAGADTCDTPRTTEICTCSK